METNNEEQTEINKETENIENENNEIKNEENTEKLENESLEKNEEIEKEKNTEEEKKEELKEESEEKDDPFKDLPLYIISCKVSIINSEQMVLYTLKGKRVKTEIQRKYSDFELLRKKIGEFLPGIFIAGLPSNDVLGDVDNKASEMRLKLLNHFIRKITENPEFYNTEPFLFFLTDDKNYKSYLDKIEPGNPEEIKERFTKIFPYFNYDNYNTSECEQYVDYWNKIFIKARDNIDKIGQVLENEILNIIKEQKYLNNIFDMFVDFENAIPNNTSIIKNPKDFCNNMINSNLGRPYFVFYHYHLKTIADLESFIEAYNILIKYRKKLNDSFEALKKIAQSGQSKYNINENNRNQQLTVDDKGYNEECKMLNLRYIVDCSTFILKSQIDTFRESFFDRYKNEILKMKQNLINKNLKSVQLWEEFTSSLN